MWFEDKIMNEQDNILSGNMPSVVLDGSVWERMQNEVFLLPKLA